MYIAILVMAAGICAGRLFVGKISETLLGRLIYCSILFLLFLLGLQIGANDALFSALPRLGLQAALLMLACVAGSILLVTLVSKMLAKRGLFLSGTKDFPGKGK